MIRKCLWKTSDSVKERNKKDRNWFDKSRGKMRPV